MPDKQSLQPITIACPDCDLLNRVPSLAPGESAACVRCNATLSRNPKNSIDRALALTCTAVVLFLVANTFPFLAFGEAGIVTHTTLASGVQSLYQDGMYFLAAVVGFTTIVTPSIVLAGTLYLLVPLRMGRRLPGAEHVLRLLQHLDSWNMVEIFMLGIIVSAVKLHKMADMVPGVAAWSFMLLIFALALIAANTEPRLIWERLEAAR